jgi:hypothetical protein
MPYRSRSRWVLPSVVGGLLFAAVLGSQWLAVRAAGVARGSRLAARGLDKHAGGAGAASSLYPYRGARFTQLVADSYRECGGVGAQAFYDWLDKTYESSAVRCPGAESLSLAELLAAKKREFAGIADAAERARAETSFCAYLHKLVKAVIPRFSLDRGFEFANVVQYGERQCLLQSVLIVGLLQAAGVDAGAAMVYRNIQGVPTNNGHVVPVVKLSNGHDILVDASDPEPFVHQRGLMVRCEGYCYVEPVYNRADEISGYRTTAGNKKIEPARVKTLDYDFVRSQFYFYRGERAPGGFLAPSKTHAGLAASEKQLRTSVRICPRNPLAVYVLGKVCLAEGHRQEARGLLQRAYKLYSQFGWVPAGARQSLAQLGAQPAGPRVGP